DWITPMRVAGGFSRMWPETLLPYIGKNGDLYRCPTHATMPDGNWTNYLYMHYGLNRDVDSGPGCSRKINTIPHTSTTVLMAESRYAKSDLTKWTNFSGCFLVDNDANNDMLYGWHSNSLNLMGFDGSAGAYSPQVARNDFDWELDD
ncbi:MAG: hypothetical protein PHV59_12425, partial [Victivallales bacterium]|nr:hypothetical protein [Victivallales bacterium]